MYKYIYIANYLILEEYEKGVYKRAPYNIRHYLNTTDCYLSLLLSVEYKRLSILPILSKHRQRLYSSATGVYTRLYISV